MTRIIDANLVVYALLESPRQGRAYTELRRTPAMAPDFLQIEAAYAFSKYVRAGTLASRDAKSLCEAIPTLINLVPQGPLIAPAIDLSLAGGHSVYDCLYLALALKEKSTLVTADKRFSAFASQVGCQVILFA